MGKSFFYKGSQLEVHIPGTHQEKKEKLQEQHTRKRSLLWGKLTEQN